MGVWRCRRLAVGVWKQAVVSRCAGGKQLVSGGVGGK